MRLLRNCCNASNDYALPREVISYGSYGLRIACIANAMSLGKRYRGLQPTSSAVKESSPEVGSSQSNTSGSVIKLTPILTRLA